MLNTSNVMRRKEIYTGTRFRYIVGDQAPFVADENAHGQAVDVDRDGERHHVPDRWYDDAVVVLP